MQSSSAALVACPTCFTGEAECSVCGLSGMCNGAPEQLEMATWDAQCEVCEL